MVSWWKRGYTFNKVQHTFENLSPLTSLCTEKAPRKPKSLYNSPHPLLVAEQSTCRDLNTLELNDPVTQMKNESEVLHPATATLQRTATFF